jgi:4-amino-4-deoxy-L-arabinose transferase-like glycosyltransferase
MPKKLQIYFNKFFESRAGVIAALVVFKTAFQIIIIKSGIRWLTADDYTRTVISWEWLQHPKIFSGVWLSLHFWLNGLFIAVFRDLTLAPIIANTIFSTLTLAYLFLLIDKLFNRQIAALSCLIFAVFPFQVWLSTSGMPESISFFFITAACYYFILWNESFNELKPGRYLVLCVLLLNIANLLRYEAWLFSLTFIIFVSLLSYRKFRFSIPDGRQAKQFFVNSSISCLSLVSVMWWLYQNTTDYGDAFFFIKETTRIFKDIANAGLVQRVIQYPFFVFYIAPLTTALALWKIYKILRNRNSESQSADGGLENRPLVKIYLLFNLSELVMLMLTGIFGSGGTNMVSRYVVMNSIFLFPLAAWQLLDFKKYIAFPAIAVVLLINIVWSFYYQQAYREDTYEVANLTKKLIQKNYFEKEDKIYFETVEGYYDIYPLQVISNNPHIFVSDTIPAYFPVNMPAGKFSRKRQQEEQQKLSILELRKFLEEKRIKLCIVRSDVLIEKLKKLSYKQVGDYHIFYVAENKIKYRKYSSEDGKNVRTVSDSLKFPPEVISFGKKLILKDFYVDNTNFGMNPQTVTVRWEIADGRILDSLYAGNDEFGRYYIKIELAVPGKDSTVYETSSPIFSERVVEEFFDTEEIKNIVILKPFAMLGYTFTKGRFRFIPFESGVYDLRMCVIDKALNDEMKIYKGDSLYVIADGEVESAQDTNTVISKQAEKGKKKKMEQYLKSPYYPLGRLIAMFPNVNYASILRKSKDFSQIMFRNALMLPFLQRYQGDHFLNIVFTYF